MDETLLDQFDHAQRLGFELLGATIDTLEEGMTEKDLDDNLRRLAKAMGFGEWFHPPEIQFGKNTTSNAVWKVPSSTQKLQQGDLVVVDCGPVLGEAYADVGTTIAFKAAEPRVVEISRECVRATCGFASQWKTVGELFVYARAWAVNNRLELASTRSIGHAIPQKEGLLRFQFPRSAHAATWLRRNQIRFLNPSRLEGLWAVCPRLSDGTHGAAFKEMIYISKDERRIIGRDNIAQIGTLSTTASQQ